MNKLLSYLTVFLLLLASSVRSEFDHQGGTDTVTCSQQSFIFISATQKPMWFEKLFAKTHNNENATKILFNAIEKDSSISAVFFLGDVTSLGSINKNWAKVDSFLAHLQAKNISAYAAAGNHEYLLSSIDGELNFKKRFPDFNRTGFTIRKGPLAVVMLNSNFSELNHSEEIYQQEWYLKELQTLDQDSTIKIVAVGCHRPPFSNSSIVGHSQKVREQFVPPFRKFKKCMLFLSGHAHTFQHFMDTLTNKHFLVIGGGGGLLHTLKTRKSDELKDQVQWKSDYRMFHFLRGTLMSGGFLLKVFMLTEQLQGPYPVYEVFIPFDNR